MLSTNRSENYTFDRFRVDFHKICNFIPFVSTLTNAIAAIQKRIFLTNSTNNDTVKNNHYYKYLKKQNFEKNWLLFIPIANTIFSIVKCCAPKNYVESDVAPMSTDIKLSVKDSIKETENRIIEILNEVSEDPNQNEDAASKISRLLEAFLSKKIDKTSKVFLNEAATKTLIQNILNSFKGLSDSQSAILIQGVKGCNCGGSTYPEGEGVKKCSSEIYLFDAVMALYASKPEIAKLLLQTIVCSYSTNKKEGLEIDLLTDCIQTKEQAIDFIEACEGKELSPSIKEDNLRKLALFTQDYERKSPSLDIPFVFAEKGMKVVRKMQLHESVYSLQKNAIIEAFKEKNIDYAKLLPENYFPSLDPSIAGEIFKQLPVDTLAQLFSTCKSLSAKPGATDPLVDVFKKGYLDLPTRLIRLYEFKAKLLYTATKSSLFYTSYFRKHEIAYYAQLNSILEDLKSQPQLLENSKSFVIVEVKRQTVIVRDLFKQQISESEVLGSFSKHLFELLSSDAKHSVFEKEIPGLSTDAANTFRNNCLELLFNAASNEQLTGFITKEIALSKFDEKNNEYLWKETNWPGVFIISGVRDPFDLSNLRYQFFHGLTEERQKRLVSLVKSQGPSFGGLILVTLMFHIQEEKNQNPNQNQSDLLKLAENLTISFFNEHPNYIAWKACYPIKQPNMPLPDYVSDALYEEFLSKVV